MGAYDDIVSVRADVDALAQELESTKARLADLEANVVKGGPDVSSVQGDVNWPAVKGAGYDICFPKVADGDVVDATFSAARIANIKSAGLSYAPYYFGRVASPANNQRNGRLEAAMAVYFASRQGWGREGDLPLVYDFESANSQSVQDAATHLLKFIGGYRGLMTHYPIIYTMPAFFAQINAVLTADQRASVANCPLWVAHWDVLKPTVPSPWSDWTFWQYTNKGSVPGVTGPVDVSRANITTAQLSSLRI
jgi:lysozyme